MRNVSNEPELLGLCLHCTTTETFPYIYNIIYKITYLRDLQEQLKKKEIYPFCALLFYFINPHPPLFPMKLPRVQPTATDYLKIIHKCTVFNYLFIYLSLQAYVFGGGR